MYLAFTIFDTYTSKASLELSHYAYEVAAIASAFIASKYEDLVPAYLYWQEFWIGSTLFDRDDILDYEREILQTLGFKIGLPNMWEFIGSLMSELEMN